MCCSLYEGAEFSRSTQELIKEAKDLANNGVKEITLLGQNVNAYNFEGNKLSELIYEISKIKNLERIRYDFTSNRLFRRFNSSS